MNDSAKFYKILDNYAVFKKAVSPESPDSDETLLYSDINGRLIYSDGENNHVLSAPNPLVFVSELADFPTPVSGVIELPENYSYFVTDYIDLEGNRIKTSRRNAIMGPSSETAKISSVLNSGVPLLSGIHTISLRNITFETSPQANHFDLDGSQNSTSAIDWDGVNFVSGKLGRVNTFSNIIIQGSAFFDLRDGIDIEGSVGTVSFEGTLFGSIASGGTYVSIPSGTNISRRFRTMYSSFSVPTGAFGINFNSGALVPTESYFLDTVNFAGSGTYLAGVNYLDNKANFSNCRGIQNSNQLGHYYMIDNAVATDITNTVDFVKVAGATVLGVYNQKFTDGNNRLTYVGLIQRGFIIQGTVSVAGTSNNAVKLRIAKNGETIEASQVLTTLPAGGRSENVNLQAIVEMNFGDYIEVFVRNSTSSADITVTDMSVTCHSL